MSTLKSLLECELALTALMSKMLGQSVKIVQELQLTQVLLLITLSITICVYVIFWRGARKRMMEVSSSIPYSAPALPILGHGHYFFANPETILKNAIMLASSQCPSRILLGPKLIVMITSPENLEICFNSPYALAKHSLYDFGRMALGDGVILSKGQKWKKARKIIFPIMNQKYLDNMVKVFVDKSNILVKVIEKQNCQTFDILHKLGKCALDIVCETALGSQINAQVGESSLYESFSRLFDLTADRMFKFYLHPEIIYKMTSNYRQYKRDVEYFHKYTRGVIETRMKRRQEKLRDPEKVKIDEALGYKILVDHLLENEDKLTPEEIFDEVNTFMVAASDTTVTATSFMFLMIAMHKDVQQKIYDEVVEHIGLTKNIEFGDLTNLYYTELVAKETMRLFPLGPIIVRDAEEDIKLGEHTIPKGAGIAMLAISTHRSEAYYKDPLKFIPERFLPEEVAKRHPYAYYPFTLGPRKCIGQKYGMMLMKTLVSNVLRKYRLETDYKTVEDVRLKDSVVLKALDGFNIRAFPRD